MPVMMKVSRSSASPLRFFRSVSAKTTWSSRSFLLAAKGLLAQISFSATEHADAIGSPKIFDEADKGLGILKNARTCGRPSLWKNSLSSLCAALFLVMSYAVASAQTATTTTLTVNPSSAANGSAFTLTATVKAGGTLLTGGTVTFRDTYGSVTQVLGTVQVQSANGSKGHAILLQQLGGLGTHSIVATFNAPKTFSSSSSPAEPANLTGIYSTTSSISSTGSRG